MVGEVGVWTVKGLMTDHPPGEYYQAKFYQHYFETFAKHPQICGVFLWILADYDLHRAVPVGARVPPGIRVVRHAAPPEGIGLRGAEDVEQRRLVSTRFAS